MLRLHLNGGSHCSYYRMHAHAHHKKEAARLQAAQKYNDRHKLLDPQNFQFLWVVDFPMFEWDEEESRWNAAHHPFTSVHDEDIDKLTTDPAHCRAKSYDLVL